MADRIDAVLDHVAIAVPDWAEAERRWRDELGGGRSSRGENPTFGSRQLQFANGGKLELLTPGAEGPGNFVQRFLDRFGSVVHHVTLKVPELHAALDILAGAGLEAVDVQDDLDYWKEAFLRPSQIGGLVVQIAQTPYDDEAWARATGFTREAPRDGAATLIGPLLRHSDLDRARATWTALGATIAEDCGRLRCTWPHSPLTVTIEDGEHPGPVALLMRGTTTALPPDPRLGPAVLAAPSDA